MRVVTTQISFSTTDVRDIDTLKASVAISTSSRCVGQKNKKKNGLIVNIDINTDTIVKTEVWLEWPLSIRYVNIAVGDTLENQKVKLRCYQQMGLCKP